MPASTTSIESQEVSSSSSLSFVQRQVIASAIGSITTTLVLNPIGVLKVRTQAGQGGIIDVAKQVIRESGPRGFWLGSGLGLMQSIPSTVIYMTAYENIKLSMTNAADSVGCTGSVMQGAIPGLSGAIARSLVVTVLAPLELMRTRALAGQSQGQGGKGTGTGGSMWSLMRDIYRSEGGLPAFYRGLGSTIMRDTPFSAIYWMTFETVKRILYAPLVLDDSNVEENSSTKHATVNFLSGSTSGALAAIVTHPFDVLKTQLQLAASGATAAAPPPPVPPSVCARQVCRVMAECCCPCSLVSPSSCVSGTSVGAADVVVTSSSDAKGVAKENPVKPSPHAATSSSTLSMRRGLAHIIRQRGFAGLFSGLSMRLATIIPGSGIMITVYEFAKSFELK